MPHAAALGGLQPGEREVPSEEAHVRAVRERLDLHDAPRDERLQGSLEDVVVEAELPLEVAEGDGIHLQEEFDDARLDAALDDLDDHVGGCREKVKGLCSRGSPRRGHAPIAFIREGRFRGAWSARIPSLFKG